MPDTTSRRLSPRELAALERFVLGSVATARAFAIRDPATLAALEAKLADARAADIIGRAIPVESNYSPGFLSRKQAG